MSDAVLQILLILAYLAIGLISVTFPIYTICVTYLRQEFHEDLKRRKKRDEQLKGIIAELTKDKSGYSKDSDRFEEIEKQIKKYKAEQKKVGYLHLTAIGAVMLPVVFLIIALILSCIGIYYFYEHAEILVSFFIEGSIISIGAAVWTLYKTISSVEQAAMRPARSVEFDVTYSGGKEIEEVKIGKETEIIIGASTDEDNVQNFVMYIYIPPQIKVKAMLRGMILTPQPEDSFHPGYNMVSTKKEFLPKLTSHDVKLRILARQTGEYKIPVYVYAKGIYPSEKELILKIVKE